MENEMIRLPCGIDVLRWSHRVPRGSAFASLRANGRWFQRAFGHRSSRASAVMRSREAAVEVYTAAMTARNSQIRKGCTVRHYSGLSRLYWRQRANAYRAMGLEP